MGSLSWDSLWPYATGALSLAVALTASGHAVLYKRDVRAAIGWVGLVWVFPFGGAVLYLLFGINRIRRRASGLRDPSKGSPPAHEDERRPITMPLNRELASLVTFIDRITRRPLVADNRVEPLVDGDEAYPAMLAAIDAADRSIALATYIFDNDEVGRRFVSALAAAVRRKVAVRTLIDAVGERYSWPPISRELKRSGVPVERFLPTRLPWRLPYMSLRNHRKLLIVDGCTAFTGGINIRQEHLVRTEPKSPVQDLHFRVDGPVVSQLLDIFAEDWKLVSGESLGGEAWTTSPRPHGPVLCRAIAAGPDEDFEKMQWTLLGALACAQRSVRIVTPYFLPISGLARALAVTACRGVDVDILLPQKGNLSLVQWASNALLWQVLEGGCRVWASPPPFDHSEDDGRRRALESDRDPELGPRQLAPEFRGRSGVLGRVAGSPPHRSLQREAAPGSAGDA